MSYIPIHDRPPYFGDLPTPPRPNYPPIPRYASPDIDPLRPLRNMAEGSGSSEYDELDHENGHTDPHVQDTRAGTSDHTKQVQQLHHSESSTSLSRKRTREGSSDPSSSVIPRAPNRPRRTERYIYPSFFNMSARNPVTRVIGEFLMAHCRDRHEVEVEIKLGQISTPVEHGQRWKRISLPAMTELILPDDFKVGPFRSDMTKAQHACLNKLINENTATANADPRNFRPDPSNPSGPPPHFIRFQREKQIDEFYASPGNSRVRVSRSQQTGEILACIQKRKIADLNIANGREVLDYRISVSTEEPCEMPTGKAIMIREKDRACYKHQLVQVDLTYVRQPQPNGTSSDTFELEIEVIDVPGLLAEGVKEEMGQPNQFDEMITSILDSARILIRNVVPRRPGE